MVVLQTQQWFYLNLKINIWVNFLFKGQSRDVWTLYFRKSYYRNEYFISVLSPENRSKTE